MIPKIIHYCWFGGNPLPDLAKKCIESWKKFCPDYEIVEWNENNFDVNYCKYTKQAYQAKKWAFVSDVARLYALVNYGGIYMDTDVEVLKSLDEFLDCEAFSGFESVDRIPTGIMAAEKGQDLFTELLDEYNDAEFIKEDGSYDLTTNVSRITNICLKYGLELNNNKQTIKGFTLYPYDYFCPKDCVTKKIKITKNTAVIHHFDGSWLPEIEKYQLRLFEKYSRFLPNVFALRIAKFNSIKKHCGLKTAISETFNWIKRKK